MKKIILLLAISYTLSCNAQKVSAPTYSWQISNGIFTATYTNTPWGDVGTSADATGQFSFQCLESYLEFIVKLLSYGQTPAHWRGDTSYVNGVQFILQTSHPFILILDAQGRVWKLTKSNALILANQLNQPSLINQIAPCAHCPCGEFRNSK